MRLSLLARAVFVLTAAGGSLVVAQSNAIVNRDIGLERCGSPTAYVRGVGIFPNGASAFGMGSTSCNPGTNPIPFQPPMSPNHAFIHYILARESDGRLVQISDRSYVKHTFGSSNDASTCGTCLITATSQTLQVGCNDAYVSSQAADNYHLGPPDEVDPWLGAWIPACSRFDQGDPVVASPANCDGVRSLTQTQASVLNASLTHQPRVYDVDMNVPGAAFWYQCGYLCPAEPESARGNNIGSRSFAPVWNGSNWTFNGGASAAPLHGTILQRWTGATVTSGLNQSGLNPPEDGRFFVAVKVTGPTAGLYHYEYAVHNRDNKRGMGQFRIPTCPSAQVSNFGFHDVDKVTTNEWSAAKSGAEIVFSTTNNPLRWNSIFNFWFDCDAGPISGSALSLVQFDAGAGLPAVSVTGTAPLGLFNVYLGPGCSNAVPPTLFATGSPDRATIGNATFGLASGNNGPGSLVYLYASFADGTTSVSPCDIYLGPDLSSVFLLAGAIADASGLAGFSLPVPNEPLLEGAHLNFQIAEPVPGGALLGALDLSNGLRVWIGSLVVGCP